MIQEIGCSDDGSVWFNIGIDMNGETYRGTVRLKNDLAVDFHESLGIAIERGRKWAESGVDPGGSADDRTEQPEV